MREIGTLAPLLFYALPLLFVWSVYALRRSRRTARSSERLEASTRDGLLQPASLHPAIDSALCLGCATCVEACPEHDVLGLIEGKAHLLTPANCIGHGACKDACPTSAISLVLGTEERGVDIPALSPDFETNVPGIFVAGELGGMGLIRNGIEQGRQAIDAIAARLAAAGGAAAEPDDDLLDVAIIGAGPAGFSATLASKERGLRSVTLEQESLGGTVAHYPRGKIVMTAPVELPLHGKVRLRETTKEALLALWEEVAEATGIEVRYGERVDAIDRTGDGFVVRTPAALYRARCILLAIGRRGTPRKLGVAGEDRTKVVYRLIDPEQYREASVLVVGGGDSALEAACSLADLGDAQVALSYRGTSFGRAKAKNRQRVEAAAAAGRLDVLLHSEVHSIERDHVVITTSQGETRLRNDAVIVCAGGILPTRFLDAIGIEIETHHGDIAL